MEAERVQKLNLLRSTYCFTKLSEEALDCLVKVLETKSYYLDQQICKAGTLAQVSVKVLYTNLILILTNVLSLAYLYPLFNHFFTVIIPSLQIISFESSPPAVQYS